MVPRRKYLDHFVYVRDQGIDVCVCVCLCVCSWECETPHSFFYHIPPSLNHPPPLDELPPPPPRLDSIPHTHTHTLSLSYRQQVVSCDRGDYGCNGGDTPTAYKYIMNAGGLER